MLVRGSQRKYCFYKNMIILAKIIHFLFLAKKDFFYLNSAYKCFNTVEDCASPETLKPCGNSINVEVTCPA